MASTPVPAAPTHQDATTTVAPSPKNPQDIPSFFPKIKNDLTKVTWAHAVNSQALLQKALKGESLSHGSLQYRPTKIC